MENSLGEDLPIGIYRTYDNIRNFKIKVKLRKIANACFTEKDPLVFRDTNELELVDFIKSPSASIERNFIWQEKVLKTEKKVTTNAHGIEEASSSQSAILHLFSFSDTDILDSAWKMAHTHPRSISSPLEERLLKGNTTTKLPFMDMNSWKHLLSRDAKAIIHDGKKSLQQSVIFGQTMVIMAAIFFNDCTRSEEKELCILQLDDHGTLSVIPDFNPGKPYIFINSRSETFEYEIENVSNNMSENALQREKYLRNKISLYKKKLMDESIALEFEKNTSGNTKFTLNFEIVSARSFGNSDIFIHYLLVLPKGFSTEDSLEGVTETCHCKWKENIKVAYYGYIFSIDITCDEENEYLIEESLKIIFEVTSVDTWGNFRNEGYGYSDIILAAGINQIDVYTWKVQPTTLKSRLQNFFIGGTPTLQDLSYIVNSNEPKCSQLSKYGVRTETSGIISLKCFVVKQCNMEN